MQFKDIIGQRQVIDRLLSSYRENRVAHTQLFLGQEGSGAFALALAFAQYINCEQKQEGDSCGKCASCLKYERFSHPDLHFFFPTTTNDKVKKDPKSELFLDEFREYLTESRGYITQNGWYEQLKVGNKQGMINVRDASDIIAKTSLKPYEAPYKIIMIWMAEKLNDATSNKLLKTFEEPPENTIIMLVAERYEMLLPTVRSRAQLIKVPKIGIEDMQKALKERLEFDENAAGEIAVMSSGSWNLAQDLADNSEEVKANFVTFRQWLRHCFKPDNYLELNKFISELGRLGREKQKAMLNYGLEMVHLCMLHNQDHGSLVVKNGEELEFSKKLAPFITPDNQEEIYSLLNEAVYHIERNAHPGILFSDLSFKLIDIFRAARVKK
jgi:DNA polymerase-3 subunit delta'